MNQRRFTLLGLVLLALCLLALAASPAGAAPPKGKHYAVVLMLLNPGTGEIDAAPACMSFSATEMCSESDVCGPWEFIAKKGHQSDWLATLEFSDDDGALIEVEARGFTERKGPGSSIGGTMEFTLDGVELNAGFSGVEVPRRSDCLEFGLSDDEG